MIMYLKIERLKKETEQAVLLECPDSSYSYAGCRFWLSKKQVKIEQVGYYRYLKVYFPDNGTAQLTRFIGRYKPKQQFEVDWQWIQSMYRSDHELVKLSLGFEVQNKQADLMFERQTRG